MRDRTYAIHNKAGTIRLEPITYYYDIDVRQLAGTDRRTMKVYYTSVVSLILLF